MRVEDRHEEDHGEKPELGCVVCTDNVVGTCFMGHLLTRDSGYEQCWYGHREEPLHWVLP